MKDSKKKNLYWIIAILLILVLLIYGIIIYDKYNNKENTSKGNDTTNTSIDLEIYNNPHYGTYYKENEPMYYFTLKANNEATIVESDCNGNATDPINTTYKFTQNESGITLTFGNDEKILSKTMIGIKENGSYKFTVTEKTCVSTPNETYYIQK